MPIYEYQCSDCAKLTDVKLAFKEVNRELCPACGGELKRRFTPTGIVFKGSGFYVTDSRKSAEAPAKAADTAPAGQKADGTDGKTPSEAGSKSEAGAKSEPGQKSESAAPAATAKDAPAKSETRSENPKKDAAA